MYGRRSSHPVRVQRWETAAVVHLRGPLDLATAPMVAIWSAPSPSISAL
jgi:hypothetical protein